MASPAPNDSALSAVEKSHPLFSGPTTPPSAEIDDRQEVEVWWGSYSGWAMMPSFIVCGLLSLAVAGTAIYLCDVAHFDPVVVRRLAYGLVAIIGLVQLLRVGYRTVSINYRLTNRRLLRDRGFIHPYDGALELTRVTDVVVGPRTWLERLLKVGQVRVVAAKGEDTLVLEGVSRPDHAAAEIRAWVQRAQQKS